MNPVNLVHKIHNGFTTRWPFNISRHSYQAKIASIFGFVNEKINKSWFHKCKHASSSLLNIKLNQYYQSLEAFLFKIQDTTQLLVVYLLILRLSMTLNFFKRNWCVGQSRHSIALQGRRNMLELNIMRRKGQLLSEVDDTTDMRNY